MKIVNILGGLGNQMFEYAMYLALKDAHPQEEIKVCTRSFGGYGLHNGLEIQRIFEVDLPEASVSKLAKLAYPFVNYRTWQFMFHFLPSRNSMTYCNMYKPFDFNEITREDNVFYDGYWQNEKYFKQIREVLLETYRFKPFTDDSNLALSKQLVLKNAVSCHIRRGDYLKEPDMCVCTPQYYSNAITEMNSNVDPEMYVIFSDDIQWCKENIQDLIGNRSVVYVDWNTKENSFRDLQLMTLCKHNIIANSSFSWWGAWLNQNPNKIVIAPEFWKKDNIINDPICDNWLRIKL